MYRTSVRFFIGLDLNFPSLHNKFVGRVVRRFCNGAQDFLSMRYSSNFGNQFKFLNVLSTSNLHPVVQHKQRLSHKVDFVEQNSVQSTNSDVNDSDVKENDNCRSSDDHLNNNDGDEDLFGIIDYNLITGGDDEKLNNLKLVMLEVDVLRQDGFRVPNKLSTDNWKELLALHSRSQKRKFLEFLWLVEIRKVNDKKKKERKKLEHEERCTKLIEERETNEHITYGFQGTTIFLRVYDTTINHFDNHRLVQAMLHGLNIVVDCGFDGNMTVVENKRCAKQLCYLFAENRLHRDPFNINFCNVNRSSVVYKHLKKFIPTLEDPEFPMNMYQDDYTQLFPKEKLVYLTPHCRNELKHFDPDDIYIIGAMVDRHNNEPLTMAKAKSQGLRMAQLPLDRYLDWGQGTKSLTINQVLKILLDVRTTGDWVTALKHVPQRKIKRPGEPRQDFRKYKLRGTSFQPPPNYSKVRKLW